MLSYTKYSYIFTQCKCGELQPKQLEAGLSEIVQSCLFKISTYIQWISSASPKHRKIFSSILKRLRGLENVICLDL